MSTEAAVDGKPSAGCARCGSCCDPVIIEADALLGAQERARSQEQPSYNDLFATQHWHPVGAWTEPNGTSVFMARCDAFDQESRLCTARESRPPICSRFPWYGEKPSARRAATLVPHCSFLADVPPEDRPPGSRPLIPVDLVTRRA